MANETDEEAIRFESSGRPSTLTCCCSSVWRFGNWQHSEIRRQNRWDQRKHSANLLLQNELSVSSVFQAWRLTVSVLRNASTWFSSSESAKRACKRDSALLGTPVLRSASYQCVSKLSRNWTVLIHRSTHCIVYGQLSESVQYYCFISHLEMTKALVGDLNCAKAADQTLEVEIRYHRWATPPITALGSERLAEGLAIISKPNASVRNRKRWKRVCNQTLLFRFFVSDS